MNYKINKKQFKMFEKECSKWIKYFGLLDWEVNIREEKRKVNYLAQTSVSFHNRIATIKVVKDWRQFETTNKEIKKTAFHEICEVMFYNVRYLAEARFLTESEIDPEIHKLIRILENTVFEESNA